MKIILTKSNKILIGVTLFLYLVAIFFGSLGIILHIVVIGSVIKILAKSKKNRELATVDLAVLTAFLCIFILVRIGILWNGYRDYTIKKEYEGKIAEKITPTSSVPVVPTPTIYNCPVTDKKEQSDSEREKAEREFSIYSQEEIIHGDTKMKTSITYIAKELLPCEPFDEQYCQIINKSNRETWTIKYPKKWSLYRIKNKKTVEYGEGESYSKEQHDFYDLKFEFNDSYYYLREGITLGGQPLMLSQTQWKNIKKSCAEPYYKSTDNYNYYICPGNTEACIGDIESGHGYSNKINTINLAYKSFLLVNEDYVGNDIMIYGGYIPSLNFEREELKGALRIYDMSNNFYSNDEEFISELKKIHISHRGVQ